MPFQTIVLLLLEFVIIALVSGNNLSVCSGTIIGSRIITKRSGIIITILGYIFGLFAEGRFLEKGITAVLPLRSTSLLILALSIATIIFVIAHKERVPQSLSINFTAILLGASMALRLKVDWTFTIGILLFWIFIPIIAALVMVPLMRSANHVSSRLHVWKAAQALKLIMVVLSFFTAFTLGANTLGFLYSALPDSSRISGIATAILAIIFGSTLLSGRELKRIGNEIISMRYMNSVISQSVSILFVEIATLIGVPFSNTQVFTTSVYGAGLSYKGRMMRTSPAVSIVTTWIAGAIISFFLSFIFSALIL